jgi:hypothetical protein
MVSTRLWWEGMGSEHRERQRADPLLRMVTAGGLPQCALLVLTDGWSASAGPFGNSVGAWHALTGAATR